MQPGYLGVQTRGFPSPPHDGFGFSKNLETLEVILRLNELQIFVKGHSRGEGSSKNHTHSAL